MVVYKRKKKSRMRGKTTHGWGAKKKHRNAGNRGGVGMAGSGKRADQKKPTILKLYGNAYYGKRGFKRPPETVLNANAINISDIDERIDDYLKQGLATKEGDSFAIDLEKLGYNKLLGKGDVKHKLKIKTPSFSASAKEKIEKAGGVILNAND